VFQAHIPAGTVIPAGAKVDTSLDLLGFIGSKTVQPFR
jgi:hypothetical protein